MRPRYERTPQFKEWCKSLHPGWSKLYDCERCVITESDVFPFFTELEGKIIGRASEYLVLERERSFLTDFRSVGEVFEWVVESTSGKIALIKREGFNGIMFDSAADYVITRLMFADRQAVVRSAPMNGSWCASPPYWRKS